LQDPQSLHKYLYAGDDPIGRMDPNGQFFIGILISLGSFGYRAGLGLGRYALASTALYGALGGGVGFGAYWAMGENPWLGAYNGALIGASFRIAYLTQNQWRGVGKVLLDASASGVARFLAEFAFGLEVPPAPGMTASQIARRAALKGIDSFATGAWAAATEDLLPDSYRDSETARFIIAFLDAGLGTVLQDLAKDPQPSTSEIVSDAITAASITGAANALKLAWKHNPQLPQSISDATQDKVVEYIGKMLFNTIVGFDVKGIAGLANFFMGK
jgi:hypothetical protein